MANAGFTRDEVILALDALYFSGDTHLNEKSEGIKKLCSVLQKLPIHSEEKRNETFRNEHGVSQQIAGFRRSCENGVRNPNIGAMFFKVAFEYENNKEEIHSIAESIRRNLPYFHSTYGAEYETLGFPEGALLGHLHREIEQRADEKLHKSSRCSICQLDPEQVYQPHGELLQVHLMVDPIKMDGTTKYGPDDFITVCPNCHAAMHQYRPWLTTENLKKLLR